MLAVLLILPILSCVSSQCLRPNLPPCNCQPNVPILPRCVPEYSALGCLQPTITPFGTITEVPIMPIMEMPILNPMLPAASPISALAHPFSPLFPPALPCNCHTHFLKKIPIPPPFI